MVQNMFNDGTKIKFMNNPNRDNEVIYNINTKECEEYIINELNINRHGTSGIKLGYENEKNVISVFMKIQKKFNKKYRVLLFMIYSYKIIIRDCCKHSNYNIRNLKSFFYLVFIFIIFFDIFNIIFNLFNFN